MHEKGFRLDPVIQQRIDELLDSPPDGEQHFAPVTTPADRDHPEYISFPYDEDVAVFDALTEAGMPLTGFDYHLKDAYAKDAKNRRSN